jgi:hypothetical protein
MTLWEQRMGWLVTVAGIVGVRASGKSFDISRVRKLTCQCTPHSMAGSASQREKFWRRAQLRASLDITRRQATRVTLKNIERGERSLISWLRPGDDKIPVFMPWPQSGRMQCEKIKSKTSNGGDTQKQRMKRMKPLVTRQK